MKLRTLPYLFLLFYLTATSPLSAEKPESYSDLIHHLDQSWIKGDHEKVLELALASHTNYPDAIEEWIWYEFVALGNLDRQSQGIELIKKWHEKGYFFPITEDHDWYWKYRQSTVEGYKKLCQENNRLKDSFNETSTTRHEVILPETYDSSKAYPLLYVLHGGGGYINRSKVYWQGTYLSKNFITVYLQSKHYRGNKSCVWENDQSTRDELRKINNEVLKKYPTIKDQVFVGGMSNGGMMALHIAFEDIIPINGFIANCPVVPDSFDEETIRQAVSKNIRGVIITGSKDYFLPAQKQFQALMDNEGLPNDLIIIQGMDHEFPKDFHARLKSALKKIKQ